MLMYYNMDYLHTCIHIHILHFCLLFGLSSTVLSAMAKSVTLKSAMAKRVLVYTRLNVQGDRRQGDLDT